MAQKTVKHTISPSQGYVKITNGEDKGNIRYIRGAVLKITQASSQPEDDAPEAAEVSSSEKSHVYFGLGSNTDYLYAKADKGAVEFSVTPANE